MDWSGLFDILFGFGIGVIVTIVCVILIITKFTWIVGQTFFEYCDARGKMMEESSNELNKISNRINEILTDKDRGFRVNVIREISYMSYNIGILSALCNIQLFSHVAPLFRAYADSKWREVQIQTYMTSESVLARISQSDEDEDRN
jgi:hypothetical protein